MRPNDFVMNTDYLSLAQTGRRQINAFFTTETFNAGQQYNRTQDFTIPRMQGAIDRILIARNGSGRYVVGDKLVVSTSPVSMYFNVFRINPTTVRVRLHVYSPQSAYTMPTQTLDIRIDSFQPPNVY